MSVNPDSILDTVKKALGMESEYDSFDPELVMHINSAFGSLQGIGVGSDTGFVIASRTTMWSQYISNLLFLGMVQQYIFLSVKLAFDPPGTSFGIDAIQKQIDRLEFRINDAIENSPVALFSPDGTFEGGIMLSFFAPKVVTLTFTSLITPDATLGNMYYLTMTGDCTINPPVSGSNGQHITLEITSNGNAVTWGEGWNFGAAGTPDLSSDGTTDIVSAYFSEPSADWRAGFTAGF
jgi:hypothetical protein